MCRAPAGLQVVAALQRAGAAAVTIHGRTTEQRYTKSADWQLVARTAGDYAVPIIGNGDILTVYEVADLAQRSAAKQSSSQSLEINFVPEACQGTYGAAPKT